MFVPTGEPAPACDERDEAFGGHAALAVVIDPRVAVTLGQSPTVLTPHEREVGVGRVALDPKRPCLLYTSPSPRDV